MCLLKTKRKSQLYSYAVGRKLVTCRLSRYNTLLKYTTAGLNYYEKCWVTLSNYSLLLAKLSGYICTTQHSPNTNITYRQFAVRFYGPMYKHIPSMWACHMTDLDTR